MIIVHISQIKKLTDREIDKILSSLSHTALTRINRKRNEAQRHASLCALSLIPREMQQDLDYTENGRPFFKTLDADISISHSKKYAAVAISTSKFESVGVDVEEINKTIHSNSLLRFFTENERVSVENGTPEIEIWTKKEALFKYLKNDDINFISLDSTQAVQSFNVEKLDGALLAVCADSKEEIEFIYK